MKATSEFILGDCMSREDGLYMYPDNHFDLAIVDPPYGLGQRTTNGGTLRNSQVKFKKQLAEKRWDDEIPSKEYFDELFRVSKNQVIWGGNYFALPAHRTFVVWEKMNYLPTMSQVELAWTSFDKPARIVKINSNQADRVHPTQKPVELYTWLLSEYSRPGELILDTHVGSGSSLLACALHGNPYVGYEIDPDYYRIAKQRINSRPVLL